MEHHMSSSSTHYLMWKLQSKFPPPSSMNNYFQESLVWPPRSYRCSFCRREFRSAQALGGHMNVHRRDRARLKQSPPPPPQPADHRRFNFAAAKNSSSTLTATAADHPHQTVLTPPPPPPPPNDHGVLRQFISSIRRSNDENDFVESNVVGKRHKLMCSTQEIDLELRLGYPAIKLSQIS